MPDPKSDLATVRRLEAVGLRAWPAASVQYDGSWQIRLTAGHPSRRLNSVNPLDPSDRRDIAGRVARATQRFEAYGRAPVFRQTPLSPPELDAYLEKEGWTRRDETLVMMAGIPAMALDDAADHLPLRDTGRYVNASLAIHGRPSEMKAVLSQIIGAIRPRTGLFVLEERGAGPVASVMCVHDNDLAGVFELATSEALRRRGHAADLLRSALKWARLHGAETAWLQVEEKNEAALTLYRGMGFQEIYRYAYRERPVCGA